MKLHPLLSLALAAFLCSCGGQTGTSSREAVPPSVLQALEGNYSMKLTDPEGSRYSTAVVRETAPNQFQIARITVYGPVYYSFTLGSDASVSSAQLGTGSVSYKAAIKKTTILFQKQEYTCELSK